jgi:phosphoenolpyruvate-protein kinase (PTS system EI component)
MESGGALSHGAIVAREFGLPAVADCQAFIASLFRDRDCVSMAATER